MEKKLKQDSKVNSALEIIVTIKNKISDKEILKLLKKIEELLKNK